MDKVLAKEMTFPRLEPASQNSKLRRTYYLSNASYSARLVHITPGSHECGEFGRAIGRVQAFYFVAFKVQAVYDFFPVFLAGFVCCLVCLSHYISSINYSKTSVGARGHTTGRILR